MTDPNLLLAASTVAGITILTFGALHGWRGWLDLKRAEFERTNSDTRPLAAGARIEIANLKERIRKLEAIAAGVDL